LGEGAFELTELWKIAMKARRSKTNSRKVARQEKTARSDSHSSPSPHRTESSSSDFSSPLYRPGSLINNVSRTLEQMDTSFSQRERTRIYPKMEISQPEDSDEREAEDMAKKVVQQIQKSSQSTESNTNSNSDRRENKSIQSIQRKSAIQRQSDDSGMEASPEVEAAIEQESGKGQPLPADIQEKMEAAFGEDFSAVRIHTDSKAQELNDAVQARAFTTEKDIFFNQGSFDPSSQEGQELLAHELTHVLQQTS